MLSMELFRSDADKIRADHDKRGIPHDRINQEIELDEQWRGALKEMEEGRRERNLAARGIADAKKSVTKMLLPKLWPKLRTWETELLL